MTQLEENLAAVDNLVISDEELSQIDRYAVDIGIDIWEASRRAG